jgi:hypothetical protein
MAKLEDMERRASIMESLRAGNKVRREVNGYSLPGVGPVRERELDALIRDDQIVLNNSGKPQDHLNWYRLKTDADRRIDARHKAEREQAKAQQQAAHKERCERIEEVADYIGSHFLVSVSGDIATFEHGGSKFQVREVEGE